MFKCTCLKKVHSKFFYWHYVPKLIPGGEIWLKLQEMPTHLMTRVLTLEQKDQKSLIIQSPVSQGARPHPELTATAIYHEGLLCHTDVETSSRQSAGPEEPLDPNATQETSETTPSEQPAERSLEDEADGSEEKETNQELKHKLDQSEEHSEETADQPQQKEEAVEEQEEAQEEFSDSLEPEDSEQVETFFSTMSHRYDYATQQDHIL